MSKILFLFFILLSIFGFSQSDVLKKEITLDVKNKTLEQTLNEIELISGVSFSYNSDYFPVDSLVSVNLKNESLEYSLIQLLGSEIKLKSIGSNIILQNPSAKKNKSRNNKKQKYDIVGVVYNSYTGEKLSEVTIYQIDGVRSALSKKDGSYDIKVASNKLFVQLSYSRKNYFDTIITVKPSEINNIKVNLKPDLIKPVEIRDINNLPKATRTPIDSSKLVKIFVPEKQKRLLDNIPFLGEPQPVQISFLPNIGTNLDVNGAMENKVSVNIIAGYCRSVDGVEIGGFQNIVRENVKGFQAAGFGNLVGGDLEGFQAAGFFNNVKRKVDGFQAAGFLNSSQDTIEGMQAAGFINIAYDYVRGGQFAGFANIAKDVKGLQASGFINKARNVKGVQLGVINLADSVKGVSIGLFNYVKYGYHPIEISYTDFKSISLRLKTGTRGFYNIFEAGIGISDFANYWHYDAGFGHSFKLVKSKSYLDLDLTVGTINGPDRFGELFNLTSKLKFEFSYKIIGPVYVFAGPSINTIAYHEDLIIPFNYKDISHDKAESISIDNWIGYQFGIRI